MIATASCILTPEDMAKACAGHCNLALAAVCKRGHRALVFACWRAKASYPVSLVRTKKITRSKQYTFQNSHGHVFKVNGFRAPVAYMMQQAARIKDFRQIAECQAKPRTGEQISFAAAEEGASCRRTWEKQTLRRRSGGVLAAARECQVTCALQEVYTPESPTGVYFFLADLIEKTAQTTKLKPFRKLRKKERAQLMQEHFPLVWYDCACTLKKFMRAKKRKDRTKMSRAMSKMKLSIDAFHFRKGHKGCKPGGSCPMPEVWPQTHSAHFPGSMTAHQNKRLPT